MQAKMHTNKHTNKARRKKHLHPPTYRVDMMGKVVVKLDANVIHSLVTPSCNALQPQDTSTHRYEGKKMKYFLAVLIH